MSANVENYFVNQLSDFDRNNAENDKHFEEFLIEKISNLCEQIWNNVCDNEDYEVDDIFSGNVGIAYMFWYLSKQTFLTDQQKSSHLLRSRTLISRSLNAMVTKQIERTHSFLLGNSGICLIASLIFNSCNEEKFRDHYLNLFVKFSSFYLTLDVTDECRDSLMEGRTGFICAALIANQLFNSHIIPVQTLHNIGISTIKSGKYNVLKDDSELPLLYEYMDRINIDTSHGMSGVLLGLLCIPDLMKLHPQFETHIKECIDYILVRQTPDGSYLSDPQTDSVDWCSGSSGICWLMSKAYQQWSDKKYSDSYIKCGELIWKRGLSRKGPGICSGIVGNGYTFLMLFRLTSDQKYIFRAKQFAKFIFSETFLSECSAPKKPYSLYEGWAGVVCYLVDLLKPESAKMPLFFDIFAHECADFTEDLATMSETINDTLVTTIEETEIKSNS